MALSVLIIEDEPLVAMMIEDVVLAAGADSVQIAVSESEAIELADERKPDLITSDVTLVEGTGPSAVRAIMERHGDIPVLFITATPDACSPCAPPGKILSKPFHAGTLIAEIRQLTCSR